MQISNLPKATFLAISAGLIYSVTAAIALFYKRPLNIYPDSRVLILSITGLLVCSWCSLFYATNAPLGATQSTQWLVACAYFFLLVLSNPGKSETQLIIYSILTGATLNAALALYQHWSGDIPYYHRAPPSGTFLNKNFAAQISVYSIPIAAYALVRCERKVHYILGGCALAILSTHAIHVQSRSAWLAAAAGLTFMVLASILNAHIRSVIANALSFPRMAVATTSFALILLGSNLTKDGFTWQGQKIYERASTLVQFDEIKYAVDNKQGIGISEKVQSGADRLRNWRNSIEMLVHNLPLGVGEGNFQTNYPLYSNAVYKENYSTKNKNLRYLHQDYLELVIELGIAGALFGGAVILAFARGTYTILRAKEDTFLEATIVASLLAFSVTALFSSPTYWPYHKTILLVVLGLFGSSAITHARKAPLEIKRLPLFVMLFFAIAVTGYALKYYKNVSGAESLHLESLKCLNQGDYTEVERLNKDAIEKYPYHQNALMTYGAILMNTGKLDEALATYLKLEELFPNDYRALSNTTLIYIGLNNYPKALEYCDRLLKLDPADAHASRQAASIHFQMGNYELVEDYLIPYAFGPNSAPHAFIALADNALKQGKSKEANEWLSKGIEMHSDSEELKQRLESQAKN